MNVVHCERWYKTCLDCPLQHWCGDFVISTSRPIKIFLHTRFLAEENLLCTHIRTIALDQVSGQSGCSCWHKTGASLQRGSFLKGDLIFRTNNWISKTQLNWVAWCYSVLKLTFTSCRQLISQQLDSTYLFFPLFFFFLGQITKHVFESK